MPIYEFRCKKCKNIFESLIFSSTEEKKLSCPKCGAKKPEKVMSVSAGRKSKVVHSLSSCSALPVSSPEMLMSTFVVSHQARCIIIVTICTNQQCL